MVIEKKYKPDEEPDPEPFLFVTLEQKRIDQTKPFDPKTAVWAPDEKDMFVQAKIISSEAEKVKVQMPSFEEKDFKKDQLQQVNPPKFEKCEDMSNLTYLNDASVLHNLKQRYYNKLIYTYSGLFCVAINPYKRFPIYTNRAIAIYKGKRRNEVPPHIFALSDGAYNDMMANGTNQSILITGESGAGKTENTKKVITYFANVGATSKKKPDENQKGNLEDQVVQTNPVLEAFGNAKTTRNDNSSRFGKFIRIHFGPLGKLAGADIETYLLEKARVISQGSLERSYHIFYQIMSGGVKGVLEKCSLSNNITDYHYVSQGKTTINGVDDCEEMEATDTAFDVLNFGVSEKSDIYSIVAAVMHSGEMKFKQKGREEQAEADGTACAFEILGFSSECKMMIYSMVAAVMMMSRLTFKQRNREEQAEADGHIEGEKIGKLLGVEGLELYKNLLKPRIKVGNEFVTQGRNKDQVYYSVGALAKGMYDRLFKWLVKKVNMTLDTKQKRASFIGVLDIFGFEIFDFNGFEQLCINFTNEKLQQFFNHHMFVLEQEEYKREEIDWVFMDFGMDLQACIDLMEKFNSFEQMCINFTNEKLQQFFNHHMFILEQEEYRREEIDWTFIDFGMDLQACIDLLEKPMGVLSILEEESMFPKATDKTFEDKLKTNHLGKSALFQKPKPPKAGQKEAHFAIAHYAGMVAYNLTGWLEKNKDPLNDTVVDQFKKGSNKLLIEIFADHPGQSAPADSGGGGKGGKRAKGSAFQTVSALYREQLTKLMETLRATSPHFIRCIIPNETKSAGVIDSHLVMHQLTCNGVLEGIRICRKGFPNRLVYHDFRHRYTILVPKIINSVQDDRQMCEKSIKHLRLNSNLFRFGLTKVFFRAGVLGDLEEIRDDTLNKIFSHIQAFVRGYQARKQFAKLKEQRALLLVVQRSIRNLMKMQGWLWFRLWMRVRPMIYETRIEDEIKALEEEAQKAEEALADVLKKRKAAEETGTQLLKEKTEMLAKLEKERGDMGDFHAKQEKLTAQKADLDNQLTDTQERLEAEELARQEVVQEKRKVEQEVSGMRKDYEDLEAQSKKLDAEKNSRDHQIRSLNDQIANQDEIINKMNREKKRLQEQQLKTADDFGVQEDKVTHLNRIKQKLEQTLDELEDSVEREKKSRADVDKNKRKIEGDLKLTQEAVGDLENNKRQLQQNIQRKDADIAQLSLKVEEEQVSVSRLHRTIKELQSRIEEVEEELEAERQARAKAEKQRADLSRELEELGERLDEAGGATAAQQELNKKRELEILRMRRDLEEQNIQQESTVSALKRKHHEIITDLAEQIDQIAKNKTKADEQMLNARAESHEIKAALDRLQAEKAMEERQTRGMQDQLAALTSRLEEAHRTISQLDNNKHKMTADNVELLRQVEEAESQMSQLARVKSQLQTQLDETTRQCEEETRERSLVLGKFRNLEHDLDSMKEQLDEELDHKSDLGRQCAKSAAESQMWRNKYEQEGLARAEELDEQRRKIAARLQEASDQMDHVNQKNMALEKYRQRIGGEIDEMHIEVERAQALAALMEKKAKNFDKIIADWKTKVDDVTSELDNSQRECRSYSTELFRIKSAYDDCVEQLDSVRRENKSLADEVKDLVEQISDGGRSLSEIEKSRHRLEHEKNELQMALEEAESALEQEENKVLRSQMELAQARQDIDKKVQEREDEFDNTRRNYQRQMESMQSSLESESRARSEALRLKKKLEADIGELEVAVERANVDTLDSQKSIKRLQEDVRNIQSHLLEEERQRVEARDSLVVAEKRANALHGELEESRTLLEQADRGRRQAETEMSDVQQQLVDVNGNLSSMQLLQRKLDDEVSSLHADLDEMLVEARNSDEKAKRAMFDAARLADELRSEQENSQNQEQARKLLEVQVKELQNRLEQAETNAIKNGRKIMAKLEERVRSLESELDHEQRRHGEASKHLRKADRRIKELFFQSDEDKKNQQRMQDLVDSLQQKIKTYKRQIEEAEEIAALNLAKYRKCQQELESAEERCDVAETTLSKFRARGRGVSVLRGQSPSRQ